MGGDSRPHTHLGALGGDNWPLEIKTPHFEVSLGKAMPTFVAFKHLMNTPVTGIGGWIQLGNSTVFKNQDDPFTVGEVLSLASGSDDYRHIKFASRVFSSSMTPGDLDQRIGNILAKLHANRITTEQGNGDINKSLLSALEQFRDRYVKQDIAQGQAFVI